MLASIARTCSQLATLEALQASGPKVKGANRSPDLSPLLNMVNSLNLSHFGAVSADRAKYSMLPDSLLELEKSHPARLALNQPASLFPPPILTTTIPNVIDSIATQSVAHAVTIFEHPERRFAMQVFFLPRGCVMPLHDHPHMSVITKVIHGKIDMTGYSFLQESSGQGKSALKSSREILLGREVTPSGRVTLQQSDVEDESLAMLHPVQGNLHAIRALDHTLFFDILAPPYIPPVDCTYYKLERVSSDGKKSFGVEGELDSVHSLYPGPEESSTDRFFVRPFDPQFFFCYEMKWTGPKITL